MLADLADSELPEEGRSHGSDEERVDRILAIVREVLSKPDITADDELADHGGTSLSIVRIVAVTSGTLDLDINPRDLDGPVTVRNLARVATTVTPTDDELSGHDPHTRGVHPQRRGSGRLLEAGP